MLVAGGGMHSLMLECCCRIAPLWSVRMCGMAVQLVRWVVKRLQPKVGKDNTPLN